MRYHALIPAAGNGFRFGGPMPKQYVPLDGRPVLHHVISRLARSIPLHSMNIVVSEQDGWVNHAIPSGHNVSVLRCGGNTRAESVRNGLQCLPGADDDDWIVVHDAVRPCIDRASLSRLLRELDGHPVGGLLGIPVADTLKRVDAQSRVIRTERRDSLWRAQTPQMFRLGVLRKAFACPGIEHWTDEAHAVEDFGEHPRMVAGSETNIKITFTEDLVLASAILATDKDALSAADGAAEGSGQAIFLPSDQRSLSRTGFGQDSHRFSREPDRKLIIGGVEVPHSSGLEADSDGDVVLHALCRALEQAVGRHSFSEYADKMSRRGIKDSREYVKVAVSHVAEAGYRIGNVGLSIEARTPRIDPLAGQMKDAIATLLGVSSDAVGINATSGEDLTPFGKGEGIQAFAIVNLNA